MAITTLQQVVNGILPSRPTGKIGLNDAQTIPPRCSFAGGSAGFPTAGGYSGAAGGAALTNTSPGALPFNNPTTGQNTYVARMKWPHFIGIRTIFLVDLLWSKTISATSILPQGIDSIPFPARDRNGTSNGDGVYIAIHSYSSNGSGVDALISYTNSVGVSGRAGNMIWQNISAQSGVFMPFSLAEGDLGVRSVQSVTLSAAAGSASLALVAFRPITSIFSYETNTLEQLGDAVSFAMPRLYDSSCLTLMYHGPSTITPNHGIIEFTQG